MVGGQGVLVKALLKLIRLKKKKKRHSLVSLGSNRVRKQISVGDKPYQKLDNCLDFLFIGFIHSDQISTHKLSTNCFYAYIS